MTTNLLYGVMSALIVFTFGYLSYRQNVLDSRGFLAALGTGYVVIFLGGIQWFIVVAFFLVFASATTKYKYHQKDEFHSAEEKKGARGWRNVMANGVVIMITSLGYSLSSSVVFEAMFLGAVSTAAADTLATELGLLSDDEPLLIIDLGQRVRRGVSGGVSLLGEVASLLGPFLIAGVAWLIGFSNLRPLQLWMISLISGFLGSTFDSILGATIQARYECPTCREGTEKRVHCDCSTTLKKGYSFVDNNIVNLGSTAFGAGVALGLLMLSGI